MRRRLILLVLFLPCSIVGPSPVLAMEIHGRVLLPGGLGAPGAKVSMVTDFGTSRRVWESTADAEGAFSFHLLEKAPGRTEFFASDEENFWLRTGDGCFFSKTNGCIPTLELVSSDEAAPIEIPLELRGGKVTLQVKDLSTGQFIYAALHIKAREEKALPHYCSMDTVTDGAPITLFLPPGNYAVSVEEFTCGSKTYFTATPPSFPFDVHEGTVTSQLLEVDVPKLDTKISYDNPRGLRCKRR
jgi:hypothetical protein